MSSVLKRRLAVVALVVLVGVLVAQFGGGLFRPGRPPGRLVLDVWVTQTPLPPGETRQVIVTAVPVIERTGPEGISRETDARARYRIEVGDVPGLTLSPTSWEVGGSSKNDQVLTVQVASGAALGELEVRFTAVPVGGGAAVAKGVTFQVARRQPLSGQPAKP